MAAQLLTTEQVVDKYVTGATWQRQRPSAAAEEFSLWLEAHDAALLAAQKPTYEYAYAAVGDGDDTEYMDINESALAYDALPLARRRVGPWEPLGTGAES